MRSLLITAVLLASPLSAQSVTFEMDGIVSSIAVLPQSGPYAATQIGDAVQLQVRFTYPGMVAGPAVQYPVVLGSLALQVGATQEAQSPSDNGPLSIRDGSLIPDGFVYGFQTASNTLGALTALEATANVLPSANLQQLTCIWSGGQFDNPTLLLVPPGGGFEIDILELRIRPTVLLGSPYCGPAASNSSGQPATLEVFGSAAPADGLLALQARGLPVGQFAYFLASQDAGLVVGPGGSQGTLCLGGAIGRYNLPGQILNTGAACADTLVLDPAQTPTPSGPTSIQVGQTWRFQCWYRDANPGPTSNFSDAVEVLFL